MIFLDMEEHDWPLARSILLWICAHDRLHRGGPIPLHMLRSFASRDRNDPAGINLKYSTDDIRDLCGCLVSFSEVVGRYSVDEYGKSVNSYLSARLAHYTVVEYLLSTRIRNSKVSYFALSEDSITHEYLEPILEVRASSKATNIVGACWDSFEHYCADSVDIASKIWGKTLTENNTCWTLLKRIWEGEVDYFGRMGKGYDIDVPIWVLPHHEVDLSALQTRVIISLFLKSRGRQAEKYIEEKGVGVLLDNLVEFSHKSDRGNTLCSGSALETLRIVRAGLNNGPFMKAAELAEGHVCASRMLLIYTALHWPTKKKHPFLVVVIPSPTRFAP
ncbi:hypothetical protein BJ170DRAFT_462764 [Xylariales sp. AK1849]|nr:hypothetical protein BJ170DRAFT_462764 [Xylariales sp. AK1849]